MAINDIVRELADWSLSMLHYSAEYSDMDFNNKEYPESRSVCMYNIYTVYERVDISSLDISPPY